jgi:type III pantothenate kinase
VTAELVTLDLGNSALKLRRWEVDGAGRARIARAGTLALAAGDFEDHLARWLESERGVRAGLSSVASSSIEQRVRVACAAAGLALLPTLDSGIENATLTPATLGSDRLFAARGAWERVGASALVIDAGTAVTVDVLECAPKPRFLGGAIAPGPSTMARALHQLTARLPEVELEGAVPALGRETLGALRSGVYHGFRGAVAGLVSELRATLPAQVSVVLTGGAAGLLLEPPFVSALLVHEPELVHYGILAALLDEGGAARRHGLWA